VWKCDVVKLVGIGGSSEMLVMYVDLVGWKR
jgi:hypothetical protein